MQLHRCGSDTVRIRPCYGEKSPVRKFMMRINGSPSASIDCEVVTGWDNKKLQQRQQIEPINIRAVFMRDLSNWSKCNHMLSFMWKWAHGRVSSMCNNAQKNAVARFVVFVIFPFHCYWYTFTFIEIYIKAFQQLSMPFLECAKTNIWVYTNNIGFL